MKDRPERNDRIRWVVGVGVVVVLLGAWPGRVAVASTEGVARLAAGGLSPTLVGVPAARERARVQIPSRPELRSPCRPPVWVPGPPPWAGGPQWVPGPPPWAQPSLAPAAAKRAAARPGNK